MSDTGRRDKCRSGRSYRFEGRLHLSSFKAVRLRAHSPLGAIPARESNLWLGVESQLSGVATQITDRRLFSLCAVLRNLAEEAQQVAAPKLVNALVRITAAQHRFGDHGQITDVAHATR
jgi:hypothetical protein